jgi:hypothetical protein
MDKDCVVMLKRMYSGEDGSTKEELMEYGISLPIFMEVRRKVRKYCRL